MTVSKARPLPAVLASLRRKSILSLRGAFMGGVLGGLLAEGSFLDGNPAGAATTIAVSGPATLPKNRPLPDGVLAWSGLTEETNVVVTDGQAHFVFSVTNISPRNITIQGIQPSCGCTTVQSPPLPWVIAAGTNGQFALIVRMVGKAREQAESALIDTDHGFKVVFVNLHIQPPAVPYRSRAELLHDDELARTDRQAIFQGECVTCHVRPGVGKDGKDLYYAICAVCHEGKNHLFPTPDLFAVKTPANVIFWLDGIAQGKPGTLMPAFSSNAGGPLSEMQIAGLARFLNTTDHLDAPP